MYNQLNLAVPYQRTTLFLCEWSVAHLAQGTTWTVGKRLRFRTLSKEVPATSVTVPGWWLLKKKTSFSSLGGSWPSPFAGDVCMCVCIAQPLATLEAVSLPLHVVFRFQINFKKDSTTGLLWHYSLIGSVVGTCGDVQLFFLINYHIITRSTVGEKAVVVWSGAAGEMGDILSIWRLITGFVRWSRHFLSSITFDCLRGTLSSTVTL